jgi:hypothetical protein
MPNLRAFMREGVWGVLESTQPPITPAAWTTFMTGKGPGRHGILDFETYDATTHTLTFNSTYEIREKTLWQLLSEKGLRVGSLNVPMTYPPKPVSGFMISNFGRPASTRSLAASSGRIFRVVPGDYRTTGGGTLEPPRTLRDNLDYIAHSFERALADPSAARSSLGRADDHSNWWTTCSTRRGSTLIADSGRYGGRASRPLLHAGRRARRRFDTPQGCGDGPHHVGPRARQLDGRPAQHCWPSGATWAALVGAARARRLLVASLHQGRATLRTSSRGISATAVDWSAAGVRDTAGIYGYLYINLKGRGRFVEPRDYDSLRELAARFRAVHPPRTGHPDFPRITGPKSYTCSHEENPICRTGAGAISCGGRRFATAGQSAGATA